MGEVDELVIRRASSADVPLLSALIEASVRGLQAADYTNEQLDGALGHALGLDSQLIADGTYFLAETRQGEIVASGGWSYRKTLCGGDHLAGRETGSLDPGRDAAKIRAIYVHPRWARKGLGSKILEHCERQAQAAGFQELEMGSTLTGVPLYETRGYREVERMAIASPNGEHYIVVRMNKCL
jgi:N-acetylglutamate synthase-like GNAT family acetyltransferase